MRGGALKGHLDGMLLAVVSTTPSHGYAIIQELRRRSEGSFDLPEGTVYPALHRLEASGLIDSDWCIADGRRRRVYRITRSGRSALGRQTADWRGFSRAVNLVLGEVG